MPKRFEDFKVCADDRYSLGRDRETGEIYISVPVANRLAEYEEYYVLSGSESDCFCDDGAAARAFADECRARLRDDRLILRPGRDRGTAV